MDLPTKKIEENQGIKGRLTFTNFLLLSERAREIDAFLKTATNLQAHVYDRLVRELRSLCEIKTFQVDNLVVLTGREVFARRLIGDSTYTGAINYGALGTDNTAVNSADTTLGVEVARKLFSRRTRTNAQVDLDFFYSQSDTDGTYEEFGTFIDGAATADSGVLFNHALTGGWTKTDTEAMTVSLTVTISDS